MKTIEKETKTTMGKLKVTTKRNNCLIVAEETELKKVEKITFKNNKVQIEYNNGETKELEKGQDIMLRLF